MRYVHFTSLEHAKEIQNSQRLKASTILVGVFAVAVGGSHVPGVQLTKLGRPQSRDYAVVFSAKELPDVAFPEEVIWHLPYINIHDVEIVPASEAVKLLDGSLPVDKNDFLEIPLHPSHKDSDWNTVRD